MRRRLAITARVPKGDEEKGDEEKGDEEKGDEEKGDEEKGDGEKDDPRIKKRLKVRWFCFH
jgi:hypothetical protein